MRIAGLWVGALLASGCSSSGAARAAETPDAYGAAYEGDGVQCGAIVCSGAQLCCLVEVASDAMTMGPRQTCDQNCESVCADVCPDAGASSGGPAPPMPAGDAMASMTMPAPMPDGAPPMMGAPPGPGADQ